MGFWFVAKKVIGEADIVVIVFDARMPEMTDNYEIENLVYRNDKEAIIAFNKIDLVSEDSLNKLKKEHPDASFVSGIKNIGIGGLKRRLQIMGKRMGRKTIKIGVVGYPNVGKSAIINALAHRARAAISSVAGTTKGIQFVRAGNLKILDSPGVITLKDKESKLGFIGAKNPEKLKNPEKVAFDIIFNILIKNKKSFEDYAGISVPENENNAENVFYEIGKKRGWLKKGGFVDERRAAIQIIRDWQKGKLKV